MKKNKLVVVGLGHVGSYVLADAMKSGLFAEIGLIDIKDGLAAGEALDQAHATALTYMNNVTLTSGGYEQCADADIIIIAAGASIVPNEDEPMPDRTLLTADGAKNIRQIMGDIVQVTKEAIIIVISNPCDTLTYIAADEFDYPREKVMGTGTMLDSARLRHHIASRYNIDPKSVSGYMMGEHGMTAFPVLSHLTIGGIAFEDAPDYLPASEDVGDADAIADAVVKTAYDVLNMKKWTNAGVAQAAITLAKAIVLDERSIYPVSTKVDGEYGYQGDVAFSMPCIIGINGVEQKLPVTLNEWETGRLTKATDYIKATIAETK